MLIICTSDIHGRVDLLKQIYQRHLDADLFLDAGDSERQDFELEPFQSVKGNCDHFIKNKVRIINLGNNNIYVTHGNQILLSKEVLSQIAKMNNCNIIIHGHTHIPYYTFYDGVHIICPGSISFPRSIQGTTYAMIKINQTIDIEIKKVKQ